jgi:UDP-glucuronate decarboxylase
MAQCGYSTRPRTWGRISREEPMGKRILVTGGAGFLGSHLCERLLAEGHDVVVVDNFFTGRRSNVDHLLDLHQFELIRHDVCDRLILEVDQVYHLACPASPLHYSKNPVRTIRTCVQGTLNMLDLAREVRARILIASTSEVYGDPLLHPQPESYWGNVNPIGPRACYDEGKRCAEALAISYARQSGLGVRIARIFNTYGPRMAENDGRVISTFALQCLQNQPVTIFGDGSQTRSFCYVDDLVEALMRLMASSYELPMNLGNPTEVTMLDIATRIKTITRSHSEIIFEPLPQDDPCRRKPDIALATQTLDGWVPVVPLEEGLVRTVADFRTRLRAPRSASARHPMPSGDFR